MEKQRRKENACPRRRREDRRENRKRGAGSGEIRALFGRESLFPIVEELRSKLPRTLHDRNVAVTDSVRLVE